MPILDVAWNHNVVWRAIRQLEDAATPCEFPTERLDWHPAGDQLAIARKQAEVGVALLEELDRYVRDWPLR